MPTVRILHHLARSGGTLISKCLGSMEGVFLLSEVHPNLDQTDPAYGQMLASLNPLTQAVRWHQLPTEHDLDMIKEKGTISFPDLILLLAERAESRGGLLLIRDWTHLDFVARPFLKFLTLKLTTVDVLKDIVDIRNHITIRHPIDQLISLSKLGVMQGAWDIREYFHAYRVFAELAQEVGFTRYEEFTKDPDFHLKNMCQALEIPFDPQYAERWPDYKKITGDDSSFRTIRPVCFKQLEPEQLGEIRKLEDYQKAVELFGYDP